MLRGVHVVWYPLERGGPPRIEVDYLDGYRRMRIKVDGVTVADTRVESLREGVFLDLPDGRLLRVVAAGRLFMWVGDQPVPGTRADPWVRVKSAAAWFLGIAFVATAETWLLAKSGGPAEVWGTIALAAFLCWLAMRRASLVAHAVAVVVIIVSILPAVLRLGLDPLSIFVVVFYAALGGFLFYKVGSGAKAAWEIRERSER